MRSLFLDAEAVKSIDIGSDHRAVRAGMCMRGPAKTPKNDSSSKNISWASVDIDKFKNCLDKDFPDESKTIHEISGTSTDCQVSRLEQALLHASKSTSVKIKIAKKWNIKYSE